MMHVRSRAVGMLVSGCMALAACAAPGGGQAPGVPPAGAGGDAWGVPAVSSAYVKHVVLIVQENRTFDDFFATYPGADGATTGKMHDGKTIKLKKIPLEGPTLSNGWSAFSVAYNGGKMDGFDLEKWGGPGQAGTRPYTYVDPVDVQPYWAMAQQYVLGDHMFQGQGSGSFTAHQELVAGGEQLDAAHALVNWPQPPKPGSFAWGCDAPKGTLTSLITQNDRVETGQGPFPCFTYESLADQLDAKGISWRYYAGPVAPGGSGNLWNGYDAIKSVRYGSDWTSDIVSPPKTFLQDVANGKLAAVTWITPTLQNSDHEYGGKDHGPSWVAAVVNAIGESSFWDSTAIVVVWDDWGGHYDHVPPKQFGFGELGFRVPLLVISPYVHAGYISHTQYEFGSILHFIEKNWGLQPMQAPDRRATGIGDVFDFKQKPRAFSPIPAHDPPAYFEREVPSNLPLDGP